MTNKNPYRQKNTFAQKGNEKRKSITMRLPLNLWLAIKAEAQRRRISQAVLFEKLAYGEVLLDRGSEEFRDRESR